MKILKIYIKDFGCFCDRSFDFADNLNIISGNNESGKSTLISFIKFILYGMPKKSAENAVERGRTISWSTNSASGYMQLEHGGKTYTVTRQGILRATEKRESYSEQCTITDDETGLAVHSGEVPGELFLGVPSAVFESTCFISQLGCNDISPDDVNRSLENMLISADESLSVKKSLEKLDMARKALRHKVGRGGSICELEDKKEGLKSRLRSSMDGYNKIISETESVDELRRTIIERRAELDRADDRLSALSMVSTVKRFDMLHQKEKEKAELDERLRNYKTENSLNGYIPNEEYISSLSEAISSELQAKNALSAAKKELDTERDAKRAFEEKNSVALVEKLRRIVPATAECDAIKSSILRSAAKKKASFGLMIASLFFLLAAIAAFALLPLKILIGLGLSTVFAVLVLVAIIQNAASKKLLSNADAALSELGAPHAASPSERLELLKNNIRIYTKNTDRQNELEHRVSLALSAHSLRMSDLELCQNNIATILQRWSGGESLALNALSRAKEVIDNISKYSFEISHLDREITLIAGELSEYNEKSIRARVPSELIEAYSPEELEKSEYNKRFLSQSLRVLSDKCREAERELLLLENETENPARISAELEAVRAELARQKLLFDAIIAASDAIEAASANIRSTVTPVIKKYAGEFLSILTDNKYSDVGIDDEYNMSIRQDGVPRSVDLHSGGTKDAAYISLRLALLSIIYKEQLPPLAIDDALAQLDDVRARNALKILSAYCDRGAQCLIFTCHTREQKLLKDIASANIIQM